MKKIIFTLLFSTFMFGQDYFIVDIEPTGESTLFIFQDIIPSLEEGDELGLFDLNGVIDDQGNTGEILVGSGVWNGSQLNITTIQAVDLSQFGGPILPGSINGNPMILKVWQTNYQLEYTPSYTIEAGGGTFDDLFTVISGIECPLDSTPDECGVCDGPGAIYECGCSDIPDGECDCNGNVEDCSEQCGGNLEIDECGVCDGDNSSCADCAGEPYGDAILDECGVCNGPGIIEGTCDCDGNILDCLGVCGGGTPIDDCGVCDGDGTQCDNSEVVLSFYDLGGVVLTNISYENLISDVCLENVIMSSTGGTELETSVGGCISFTNSEGTFPIYMKNTQSVAGFQFNITGLTILGASGGASADAGFTVSTSASVVLGFSFSGSSMNPSGDFWGCLDFNACNYNPWATIDDNSCEYPEEGYDCQGNCVEEEDCAGECGGDAEIDECGVCEGPGAIYECGCYDLSDIQCDCDGNIYDCEGACGGSAEEDCSGICNGTAEVDECGECEGSGATFECEDGSFVCDEADCEEPPEECDDDEFDCGDGLCIDGSWECDGTVDCSDGSDESDCSSENCYDTDCGFYLLLDLSCEYAMEYGADCTICDEEGFCSDDGGGDGGGGAFECEDNEIPDCFGACSPASWLGDGWCDEGMFGGGDYNCLEYAYDNGDCQIDFVPHISSIISANCTGYCHTGTAIYENGLNLETYSSLMEGGNSGSPVVPYYPEESLIIQKLIGTAPGAQMPFDLDPLPNTYIATIFHWITQGAIGSDDDGWEGGCEIDGLIEDCDDMCVDENLLGDGNCDDGEEGEANFNCPEFYYDYAIGNAMPDCPVGTLDFGEYTFNEEDGSGTIEILMNCEYPVSNFEIELSGLVISSANGGTSEQENFNVIVSDSTIQGSNSESSSYIPENSGLLTILNFNEFLLSEICFENSTITTSIGMTYAAVLGDCVDTSNWLDSNDLIPDDFQISSVYPNPFNPLTTIEYNIIESSMISLYVYDLQGRKIATLFENSIHSRGFHSFRWDAGNMPSGIYILELVAPFTKNTKKVILTK